MYFITEKTSETGQKFEVVSKKLKAVFKAQKEIAKKYGFDKFRGRHWVVAGGFSSVIFNDETKIDKTVWKQNKYGEWMPKLNSVVGKEIAASFKGCPTVGSEDLNMCIGFDGALFQTIGYAGNCETHFGFIVEREWKVKIPKDCTEVTETEYNKMFKIK